MSCATCASCANGIEQLMTHHRKLLEPKFKAVETEFARRLEGTGFARWTKPLGGYFVSVDTQAGERECQRRRRLYGCFPRSSSVAGDCAGRELQRAFGRGQHVNLYCAQPEVNSTYYYIQFQFETCHGLSARSTFGGHSEDRSSLIPSIAFATHSGGKAIPAKQG